MEELTIVYVLSNSAMPGLIKIGRTTQEDAKVRIDQLYSTGVPVPFTLEYACKVPNSEEVESALHFAFPPSRINPKREFFRMEADQAIAILKLLHKEDATAELAHQPTTVDATSIAAADELTKRRPHLDFQQMGIPIGETLQSTHGDTVVTVLGPRKVKLGDEETSLSDATRRILELDYYVRPVPHWTYKGRLLSESYDETYTETE
jgi:hypothetical protein